ncbi:MAG: retropepsin-like domain-containing protein [Bacteroidales bacterium]|nr:retropepsin-like domain-containing protein [Bacteroidales bacterium]MCB9013555.1 retropepsin-like domain-containing protein [Bacteroidales bacterium]
MTGKIKIPVKIIELDRKSIHLLVEGHVNDLPVNLIIDTGASRTVFDSSLKHFSLESVKSDDTDKVSSAGIMAGEIESEFARARSFQLGKSRFENFLFVLIDLDAINRLYRKVTGIEIHGLLGSDFLMDVNALIDYERSLLIINSQSLV